MSPGRRGTGSVRALGAVLAISAVLLLLASSDAVALDGPYAAIHAGVSFPEGASAASAQIGETLEAEYDGGPGLWAALGWASGILRFEAELGYRHNPIERFRRGGSSVGGEGDLRVVSVMMNVYLDGNNRTFLTPYLGGGLGFAEVSIDDGRVSGIEIADMNLAYAYQAGAGVGIAVTESVTLDLGYRYLGTRNPTLNDSSGYDFNTEYRSHSFVLGTRIRY